MKGTSVITIRTIGYNQDGVIVVSYKRTIMVYKRGYAPEIPQPQMA